MRAMKNSGMALAVLLAGLVGGLSTAGPAGLADARSDPGEPPDLGWRRWAALPQALPQVEEVPGWTEIFRVTRYDPAGIPCLESPAAAAPILRTLRFRQPLRRLAQAEGFVQVEVAGASCWVAAEAVSQVHTSPVLCVKEPRPPTLLPIAALADFDPEKTKTAARPLGTAFPTFYQIALETFYPLRAEARPVSLRDRKGDLLARVSPEFRRALLMQGTAALTDGRIVNVGAKVKGKQRFVVLPDGSSGLGILGFRLYPYRSVAVDFDFLCRRLGDPGLCDVGNAEAKDPKVTTANRKALAGSLLYLPRLAGITMGEGLVHDGYVCAVDVGGGIRNDRIDIFVGPDGAGNPYYPPCRRDNPFLRAGIESLLPTDWLQWQPDGQGNWVRSVETEYRDTAGSKALDVRLVPGVRCRREAAVEAPPAKEGGR
jgi:hypothetical protein